MHLTKMEINTARRGARRLIGSPQAMHAAVLAGLGPEVVGRPLWRLDIYGREVALYILSERPPDLTHLVEQAGWPTARTWQTRDYTGVLDGLSEGQVYGFRLTANPTHAVKLQEGGRSKRLGHVTVAQQARWLHDREIRLGIELGAPDQPSFQVVHRAVKEFRRENRTVTISTATYEGVLRVADAYALRNAIVGGVGPAKAYGCGLLTLAPVRQVDLARR